MAPKTITITKAEYARLKRAAESKVFMKELDKALASCVKGPLKEIHPNRRRISV